MAVRVSVLGSLPDGREVHKYTLVNGRGSEAAFTDLGAIWTNMRVRDRDGVFRDVVLGCDKPEALLRNPGHMGRQKCQPDRRRQLHAERRELYARKER